MAAEIVEKELWDHYSELPNPAWYEYKNNKNKNMRIHFDTLKDIQLSLGDFEVGGRSAFESDETLTLRFGYWKRIDVDKLQELLPNHLVAKENLVDEDDDCGELVNYVIDRR